MAITYDGVGYPTLDKAIASNLSDAYDWLFDNKDQLTPTEEDIEILPSDGQILVGEAISVPLGGGADYTAYKLQSANKLAPIAEATGNLNSDGSINWDGLADSAEGNEYLRDRVTDTSEGQYILQKNDDTITIPSSLSEGITYLIQNITDSLDSAATAVSNFINDLVTKDTGWFSAENGAQLSVATWLSQNIAGLLDGSIDADDALIGLAKQLGQDYLLDFVPSDITNVSIAQETLTGIFEEFGLESPAGYAAAIQGAIGKIALSFVTSGFDVEQALKAGTGIIAGSITAEAMKSLGYSGVSSAAAVAAVSTAVIGLINTGDFDSGDWLMLGAQIGIAAGAGAVGTAIGSAVAANIPILGVDPVTIVASAIISLVAGKLISKIFGSKKFYEGEFGDPSLVWNSIYQVHTITVDGQQVPALVAVNANGSTVIAAGTGIGYVLGNSGSDVLVSGDGMDTVVGNDGADYLEARGGDDNLIGGNGNDHLNGGDGKDILQGDAGEDIIFGEDGDDIVIAGTGDDFVHLGTGNDIAANDNARIVYEAA